VRGDELAMLPDGKQNIQVIEDHLAPSAQCSTRPIGRPRRPGAASASVSVKTLAEDPAKATLVPMLHAKCRQDIEAVRAGLTERIDELRGTQMAMLSAFATRHMAAAEAA